ncbi:MAG: hypothetical protein H7Y17_14115 [Chlorobia bacterium]|nr:hypothetical protein [Fimbriimonadaceae bacterium]
MRRRWKLIVALLACIALATCILLFQPQEDDGLGWIRKYGPSETVTDRPTASGQYVGIKSKWLLHEFKFKGTVPPKLEIEYLARLEKEIAEMDKGNHRDEYDFVDILPKQGLVLVERPVDRNWIDQQWRKFRRAVGLLPMKQP